MFSSNGFPLGDTIFVWKEGGDAGEKHDCWSLITACLIFLVAKKMNRNTRRVCLASGHGEKDNKRKGGGNALTFILIWERDLSSQLHAKACTQADRFVKFSVI